MSYYPPVDPYAAGFGAKCPRCGQGRLFRSFLALEPHCPTCGLDYAQADAGDGPAVFVIFIVGFLGVALAFIARFIWSMPMLAAFLISSLASVAIILALLRPLKATLIALQYRNKAEEGRLER